MHALARGRGATDVHVMQGVRADGVTKKETKSGVNPGELLREVESPCVYHWHS